ncbi:prepilin-type N-terminal cleavage/methylation domain-containing protein [Chamaesiphon sp.]|uniref:type IV pilus modification PilV family protein n=1 Tax=Chamaesiphon sp. TaxID=2814140 RepID=UPI003593EF06
MPTTQPQRFQISAPISARWRLNDRSKAHEGGFSLSEVLVAILITTIFVAVALQGMVVAMLLKSKALYLAEANRWVQADVEQMRSQVTLSNLPLDSNSARCHPLSADAGFADLVRDNLAGGNVTGTADYSLAATLQISQTGKTFQIARTLSIPSAPANAAAKVLGIEYKITPMTGVNLEQPILHFYTEVMPDAALQCQ